MIWETFIRGGFFIKANEIERVRRLIRLATGRDHSGSSRDSERLTSFNKALSLAKKYHLSPEEILTGREENPELKKVYGPYRIFLGHSYLYDSNPYRLSFLDQDSITESEMIRVILCQGGTLDFLNGKISDRRILRVDGNNLVSLYPLKDFRKVRILSIANMELSDISLLEGLKSLQFLRLKNVRLTDPGPLSGLPLLRYLKTDRKISLELLPNLNKNCF